MPHVRITTGKQGRTPRGTIHIDAAVLPNPYEEKWLRPRDGRDKHVQAWLLKQPGVGDAYTRWLAQVEARRPATISVVCSAGKHRSVAVGEWLAQQLTAKGWEVNLMHRQLKPHTTKTVARDMERVTVVAGPPAAGKTTHVREHAQPGDVIIDFDHIANALSGQDVENHEHASHIATIAKAARQAAIDTAIKQDCTVWLIHAIPGEKKRAEYRSRGAKVITIDPGKDVVMKRIKTERPPRMAKVAAAWYDKQVKAAKTTTQRGYGHTHQKQRRKLLAQHKDGAPCPECGKPMYKTAAKNFDGAALEADHGPGNALKYADNKQATKATRLLHRTCNRSGGAWDKPRPARPVPKGQTKPGGFIWG